MSDRDRHALLAIWDSLKAIGDAVSGLKTPEEFHSRRIVFDSVLMNFIVIGEMSR